MQQIDTQLLKERAKGITVKACDIPRMSVEVTSPIGWHQTVAVATNFYSSILAGYIIYCYYDPEIQDDKITHRDGLYPAAKRFESDKQREEVLQSIAAENGVALAEVTVPYMAQRITNADIKLLTGGGAS